MAHQTVDLWPDGLEPGTTRTPVSILREQAALLGQKTNNLVVARVSTYTVTGPVLDLRRPGQHVSDIESPGQFGYTLKLVAPALDNYTFRLFTIEHGMDLYPVKLRFGLAEQKEYEAASEEQFIAVLKEVLSSPETKRVIQTLLAQSES